MPRVVNAGEVNSYACSCPSFHMQKCVSDKLTTMMNVEVEWSFGRNQK